MKNHRHLWVIEVDNLPFLVYYNRREAREAKRAFCSDKGRIVKYTPLVKNDWTVLLEDLQKFGKSPVRDYGNTFELPLSRKYEGEVEKMALCEEKIPLINRKPKEIKRKRIEPKERYHGEFKYNKPF